MHTKLKEEGLHIFLSNAMRGKGHSRHKLRNYTVLITTVNNGGNFKLCVIGHQLIKGLSAPARLQAAAVHHTMAAMVKYCPKNTLPNSNSGSLITHC